MEAATDEDSAAAAPLKEMNGSRSGLGKVVGRHYPVPATMEYLHPIPMLTVIAMVAGYTVCNFIPDISKFGMMATWQFTFAVLQAAISLWLVMMGGGPKWAWLPYWLLICVLQTFTSFRINITFAGAAIAYFAFAGPMACLKKFKRPSITLAIICWFIAFQMTLLVILQLLDKFQTKACKGNKMCEGMVLPAISWFYTAAGLILAKIVVQKCAPLGTPLCVVSSFIAVFFASAEMLKLVSFLQSATVEDESQGFELLMTAVVTSFAGDIAKRVLLPQRFISFVARTLRIPYKFSISPEMDLVLRSSFQVSYYPLIPVGLLSVAALAGGADWAQKRIFWIAVTIFVSVDLVEDTIIVVLHRFFYPVKESFFTSWAALMDPRQNWPALQLGKYASSTASRRKPSIMDTDLQDPWSKSEWMPDVVISTTTFFAFGAMTSKYALGAVLGRCGLDVPQHLCQAFLEQS